jgi:ABC-type lipoprotein export system ATPase subunit
VITLNDISKSYGAIKAVEHFSLEAEKGKVACVIGSSGCGKSTLLKLIALIAKPTSGEITLDGKQTGGLSYAELDKMRNENVAFSFQESLLLPYLTAVENITIVAGVRKEDAVNLLSQLGLSRRLNHKPAKLSVGEKKRVDIARALLRKLPLVVADEPLSNLDPDAGSTVMELMRAHTRAGGTVVFSSVQPSDAQYADVVRRFEKVTIQ